MPLFGGIGPVAIGEILRLGRLQDVRRGATLFAQGAAATSLHLLLEGFLKVVQTGPDGRQIVVRLVGPREPAGVLALLGPDQTYPATVLAVAPSVVLTWAGAALHDLREHHTALTLNAMRALGSRTQEAHARLREAAGDPVERRLAATVLRLAAQIGARLEDGSIAIAAPLARQDLAELAGTTLATASRVLSAWKQAGILGGGRMRLVVRDRRALMRLAGA
ncbi:Crp/Fnr family transcriptional regulator [Neoroseomonas soli]|uniref:Crp/Fnr family transcriptional regulator n=1 Tax=Neoroseomonas soli TaxID=1081025 RepID=A0A9X9WWQ9_9PROT|nr:Crp/Fnr family transcriptional regulator [Neoroseomonas soli]MBR0671588.1 Crp/Fnr family transcriptional regulator [Neoroseomonas soli]